MLLGAIADDFTGASDLANTLAKGGMATTQFVGVPARRGAGRLRGRRGRAEDPLHPGRGSGQAVAGGGRLAEGAGLRAVPVQILLDFRFDARRAISARWRKRCSTGWARISPSSARSSRRPAGGFHGPPLRRRQTAVGIGHGEASADPDDRSQHPPLAAPADQGRGRADPARHRARRPQALADGLRGRAPAGRAAGRHRCGGRQRPDGARRGARRPQAGHRRLRHRARPAGEFPPRRQACRAIRRRRPSRKVRPWCSAAPARPPRSARSRPI